MQFDHYNKRIQVLGPKREHQHGGGGGGSGGWGELAYLIHMSPLDQRVNF